MGRPIIFLIRGDKAGLQFAVTSLISNNHKRACEIAHPPLNIPHRTLMRWLRQYEDEARALIRELFVSSADIEPDNAENTLTVHVHRMACQAHDKAIACFFNELNRSNFQNPETGARLIYRLAKSTKLCQTVFLDQNF